MNSGDSIMPQNDDKLPVLRKKANCHSSVGWNPSRTECQTDRSKADLFLQSILFSILCARLSAVFLFESLIQHLHIAENKRAYVLYTFE
jgi:hypothetical protein